MLCKPTAVTLLRLSIACLSISAAALLLSPLVQAQALSSYSMQPSGYANLAAASPTPTRDPHIEAGFPAQVFGTTGVYAAGPSLSVLVGNIDEEPTLEIAVTGVAQGPLYIWNADGSYQPGWPFEYATGAAYSALGEMLPSRPGLEIMATYYGDSSQAINAYDSFANLLPGWPLNAKGSIGTPPTFADIDDDGIDEVWVPQQALYAYRADGTSLPGWPRGFPETTPAITDLDGDGDLEVISVGLDMNMGATSGLYAFHHNGDLVAGFPVSLNFYQRPYPVVGDVDGDGQKEIVVQASRVGQTGTTYLIVSASGQIERELTTASQWNERTAPALGDLDGDSYPEIVALDGGMIYVWFGDGRLFPGWPQSWGTISNQAPVIGDLDGDGWPDIAVTHYGGGHSYDGRVRVYDRFGNLLPGFPKTITVSGDFIPAIADIDLDGRNELVVSGSWCCKWGNAVWVYDLRGPGPYGRVEWGQFMGGPKHQGTYEPPLCQLGEFIDLPPGHTFRAAVACLAERGILGGYANCTFRPNLSVTRGQLAKIVSNAAGLADPPGAQIFADVPPNNSFYSFVQRLANEGAIGGYPCGAPAEPCDPQGRPYFRPNGTATRGQISKIVATARGLVDPPGEQIFTDVPPTSPFYDHIQRLARIGSMSGYFCGGPAEPCDPQARPYFRPGSNATRGQTAKIVANTFFVNCE
jgi:hypothetical protein